MMPHIPIWIVCVLALMYAIVPLAIATIAVSIWYGSSRTRTALVALVIVAIPTAISLVGHLTISLPEWLDQRQRESDYAARTRTLAHDETVAGMRIPAGSVYTRVEDPPGPDDTSSIALSKATVIHAIPVVGTFEFTKNGFNGNVTIAHDAIVGGYPCSHREPIAFYDGELQSCRLSKVAYIAGVPCKGVFDTAGRSCTIAEPYHTRGVTLNPGTEYARYDRSQTASVGAIPPSIRLFNEPLKADTFIRFEATYVEIDIDRRLHVGTCDARSVRIDRAGRVSGNGYDRCHFPLPRETLTL